VLCALEPWSSQPVPFPAALRHLRRLEDRVEQARAGSPQFGSAAALPACRSRSRSPRPGNVWYLGEDSFELQRGRFVKASDSWRSGVDGAKPGIIMPTEPRPGDSYRQEYYRPRDGPAASNCSAQALGSPPGPSAYGGASRSSSSAPSSAWSENRTTTCSPSRTGSARKSLGLSSVTSVALARPSSRSRCSTT
jgi:hypothetical protein